MVSAALVIGWLVGEFKAARLLRISLGILALAMATYAGFRSGRLRGQLEYFWVPKANGLLVDSMNRIEQLLAQGDTNTVAKAASACAATARAGTNDFGHYRAIMEMWDFLHAQE